MRLIGVAVLGLVVALVLLVGAFTLMTLTIPPTRQIEGPATGNHVVLSP